MPPGSDNHKTWLLPERLTEAWLIHNIADYGARLNWDSARIETEQRQSRMLWMAAMQGWGDETFAADTGARPEDAPDFFALKAASEE